MKNILIIINLVQNNVQRQFFLNITSDGSYTRMLHFILNKS